MPPAERLLALGTHLGGGTRPRGCSVELPRPAILGGSPAVTKSDSALFKWPIITAEDEAAVLDVMRNGNMSGTDITRKYESEFASWIGREHCLACTPV